MNRVKLSHTLLLFFISISALCYNDLLYAGRPVTIGLFTTPPLVRIPANDEPSGFFIDIIQCIAVREGWQIRYISATKEEILQRLENGEIDLVPAIPYSHELARKIDFSIETVITNWGQIYTPPDSKIKSIVDLNKKTVAVLIDDPHNKAIKKLLQDFHVQCRIIETDSYDLIVELLKEGIADAGAIDHFFSLRMKACQNLKKSAIIFNPVDIRFAVPKRMNRSLLHNIDNHLVRLKKQPDSVYFLSMKKWLLSEAGSNLPYWLKWVFAGFTGLIVYLSVHSLLLKQQVSKKTKQLEEKIHRLEVAESELEISEKRYRSVFENTGTATIIIGEGSIVTMANNKFSVLSGYSKAEIENKMKWTEFVVPEDVERMQRYHENRRDGREAPTDYEFKLVDKAGQIKNILLKVGVDPTTLQVVASLTDITAHIQMARELKATNQALNESVEVLKHAQAQLVESEKMAALGALVAGVAHEINTPVGASITAASFLQIITEKNKNAYNNESLKRSQLEKYMRQVADSASIVMTNLGQAAELINSFKRVAVDQSNECRRKFNLKSYIDEILISLGPQLHGSHHEIEIIAPEDDIEIDSYPSAFYQIFTNLVLNSIKHGFNDRDNGKITLKVHLEDNMLRMIYSDNGIGMEADQLKKIFDPFFTTKRGQGGTGLGMHIVYNLVAQTLNGIIECKSIPGHGLTCQIDIPTDV